MSKDIEAMLNNGPELTLEPLDEAVPELKIEGTELAAETGPKEVLTPEEEKQVADFAAKIDLKDSNLVLQYGAGAQKKIADFSESALDNVKSKDLGEVGQMLSQVVTELKGFEIEEEDKGFFGLFKKGTNRLEGMKAKYAKAETNVNQICKVLQNHQIQLLKDVALLDIDLVFIDKARFPRAGGDKRRGNGNKQQTGTAHSEFRVFDSALKRYIIPEIGISPCQNNFRNPCNERSAKPQEYGAESHISPTEDSRTIREKHPAPHDG